MRVHQSVLYASMSARCARISKGNMLKQLRKSNWNRF